MFDGPNWKKIGDNVFLSATGVLALSDVKGDGSSCWIKLPEVNARSYSYRYREKVGCKTVRLRCDELVLREFGLVIACDEEWFESIKAISNVNHTRNTAQEVYDKARAHAERCEDMAVAEVAMRRYPHHDERQTDFWSGF